MKHQTKNKNKNIKTMTHYLNIIRPPNLVPNLHRTTWGAALAALLVCTASASADSFFFSTGVPDGKMGTLSRPASPGRVQTETADDFVLKTNTLIEQATFTGLLPLGARFETIDQVEVEIYHVFSKDSVNPPS